MGIVGKPLDSILPDDQEHYRVLVSNNFFRKFRKIQEISGNREA